LRRRGRGAASAARRVGDAASRRRRHRRGRDGGRAPLRDRGPGPRSGDRGPDERRVRRLLRRARRAPRDAEQLRGGAHRREHRQRVRRRLCGDADQPARGPALTRRLWTAPGSQRFASGASLGLYLGSLFLAPRLGPLALGMMAALAATLFAWVRLSPAHPSAPVLARLFWIPLHLALLATGGLASPLLPLVVPWLALSPAVPSRRGRAFVAGVAAVLIAGDVWQHGVGATRWIEAVLLAAAGGLLAESYAHARRQAAIKADTLDRILEEAEVGRRGRALSEAVHRLDVLDEALDRVARTLGAARVVLWEIDVERDRAIPKRASGGPMPAPVPLAGDPLRWAWEERLPLRLEAGARWAGEYRKACIVPLEIPAPSAPLLTLAFADGVEFPSPDAL